MIYFSPQTACPSTCAYKDNARTVHVLFEYILCISRSSCPCTHTCHRSSSALPPSTPPFAASAPSCSWCTLWSTTTGQSTPWSAVESLPKVLVCLQCTQFAWTQRHARCKKKDKSSHAHSVSITSPLGTQRRCIWCTLTHTHTHTSDKLCAVLRFSIRSKDSLLCGLSHSCSGFACFIFFC